MDNIKIYAGEDFAVFGEIISDDGEEGENTSSLDDFDISLVITTTPLGKKIKGSTFAGSRKPLIIKDSRFFGMNVTGSESARMTPGEAVLSVAVTHKGTGAKMICEQAILTIIESKGKNHES